MEYIEHLSRSGDRWDLLAWEYYGDAALMAPIMDANPELRILPTLQPGLVIRIPILDEGEADTVEDLPPWKR